MKSLTKKKMAIFGLGAALCLAPAALFGAMPKASAASVSSPSTSGTATVTYSQASSWTVEIPDTIQVGEATAQIIASNVNTIKGLEITVESTNSFKLTNDKGANISYTLKVAESGEELGTGTQVNNKGTVLTVDGGSEQGASTYIGAYVDGSPVTGSEAATDTLTFTIKEKEN